LFFLLAAASLMIGMVLKDVFVGPANPFWGQTLFVEPFHQNIDGEFLNLRMKLFPVVISGLGVFLAIIWCSMTTTRSSAFSPVFLLSNKWYMDFTINHGIVIPWLNLCDKITLQLIDKGIIEMFGASGASFWQEGSAAFQSVYSGHLFHSVQIILLFTTCIFTAIWIVPGPRIFGSKGSSPFHRSSCNSCVSLSNRHKRVIDEPVVESTVIHLR
jgi:hypothetical protein